MAGQPCIELNAGGEPLATMVKSQLGQEIPGIAAVIVTLATRTDINTVYDIKGQRLSSSSYPVSTGVSLPWRVFRAKGISLLTQLKQWNAPQNPYQPLLDLLDGSADVAMLEAGWIETMSLQGIPMESFKVLNKQNTSIAGRPYPFLHSTEVYPSFAISALPHVDYQVREAVTQALFAISASSPVAQAGSFTRFTLPVSSSAGRTLLQSLGSTIREGDTEVCRRLLDPTDYDPYKIFTCPSGSFFYPPGIRESRCALLGVPCKEGVFCTCQPCKIGEDTDVSALPSSDIVFPKSNDTQVLASFSTVIEASTCARVEGCTTGRQLENMTIVISDYVAYDRPNGSSYTYNLMGADGEQGKEMYTEPTYLDGVYTFQVAFERRGTYAVSVYRDGVHLPTSPFFLVVIGRECPADQQADVVGVCQCQDGFIAMNDGCTPTSTVIVAVVLPLLALIGLAVFLLLRWQQRRADREWQISKDDIVFDDPPQVLGRGAFGEVIKGTYNHSEVAVKRLVKPSKGIRRKNPSKRARAQSQSSNMTDLKTGMATGRLGMETGRLGMTTVGGRSSSSQRASLLREMRTVSRLRHPCITSILGAVIDDKEPMFVMECLDGSMESLLYNKEVDVDMDLRLLMLKDVVQGMAFLHATNPPVLHGDLKSANLLLDSNLRVKISDFGLSQLSKVAGVGTPLYMAPEQLNGELMSKATDVYAFGIVMSEVFTRVAPYDDVDTTLATVLAKVGDTSLRPLFRPQVDRFGIPETLYELMERCWQPDAASRPSFEYMVPIFEELDMASVSKSLFKRSKDRKLQKRLLNDCFPPHIAEALKNGEKIKPAKREMTTLFFSDIVGFTNISATLSPELVSDMLDRLCIELYLTFKQ
eukprot:m.257419 g.257419  ORF g.257419 m.257419 type:complete len:871 (-) comp17583_c1_seq15:2736-5348(-)